MTTQELLALLGPDRCPQSPCLVSGERTMSRGEVWEEAATLARAIELQVPSDHRIGLVDTRDAASIVGVLAAFIAGRSVAILPVSGISDPKVEDFATDGGDCAHEVRLLYFAGGGRRRSLRCTTFVSGIKSSLTTRPRPSCLL